MWSEAAWEHYKKLQEYQERTDQSLRVETLQKVQINHSIHHVLWSGETNLEHFGYNFKRYVWCKKTADGKNTIPVMKHDGIWSYPWSMLKLPNQEVFFFFFYYKQRCFNAVWKSVRPETHPFVHFEHFFWYDLGFIYFFLTQKKLSMFNKRV